MDDFNKYYIFDGRELCITNRIIYKYSGIDTFNIDRINKLIKQYIINYGLQPSKLFFGKIEKEYLIGLRHTGNYSTSGKWNYEDIFPDIQKIFTGHESYLAVE